MYGVSTSCTESTPMLVYCDSGIREMGKRNKVKASEEPTQEISHDEEEQPKKKKKKKEIASYEEMAEAAKIKASLNVNLESKKSKKRRKRVENLKNKKSRTDQKYYDEIVEYLKAYSEDREKWKFQKTKQIYIQQHAFDFDKITADLWPFALEYLGGSQGKSKEELSKRAEEIIRKIDEEAETKEDEGLQEQPAYARARELLQMLE